MYLYVGRVVRPVWERFVTRCEGGDSLSATWSADQRRAVQQKLVAVKMFVDENADLFLKLSISILYMQGRTVDSSYSGRAQAGAGAERLVDTEKTELDLLRKVLVRSLEGLELLSIMDDSEAFDDLSHSQTPEDRKLLSAVVFKQLVGMQVPPAFLMGLVLDYLQTQRARGEDSLKIAGELRAKCPSYFPVAHYEVYTAQLLLDQAAQSTDPALQHRNVRAALDAFFEHIRLINLRMILPALFFLRQHVAATQLCLRSSLEQSFWTPARRNNKFDCYELLLQALDELFRASYAHVHTTDTHHASAKSPARTETCFSGIFEGQDRSELAQELEETVKQSLESCEDEAFHRQVFRWLSEHELDDILVKLKSPHLEEFMAAKSQALYKILIEKRRFRDAVNVLYRLATKSKAEIEAETGKEERLSLEDRMQYLNTALECLEQINDPGAESELAKLREDIEVCKSSLRIQMSTLAALKDQIGHMTGHRKNELESAIKELGENFVGIQELYENFAKRFALWEICVQIIAHSAKDQRPEPAHVEEVRDLYIRIIRREYEEKGAEYPGSLATRLHELAVRYYVSDERYGFAFPLETVLTEVERLNLRHFGGLDTLPDERNRLAEFCGRKEYWMLSFLRSEPLSFSQDHLCSPPVGTSRSSERTESYTRRRRRGGRD